MAGCTPQTFTGITAAVLACLQAKGAEAGVPISGNSGTATTMGVTIRWNYDPTSETLVIEATDAPFYVPCSMVHSRVNELINDCLPQSV
jgi:hypothetical protein